MWFKQNHSGIALDAGAGSISLCQLVRHGSDIELHRWGILEDPLREQPAPEQIVVPSVERTARLVNQSGFQGNSATLALKPPDAYFHSTQLADELWSAPRAQQLSTLQFDLARQLQGDPGDYVVDFWPLPPSNRSGNNVMVVSASHEVINRWYRFFTAVGLELLCIDVLPCALLRSARRSGMPGPSSTSHSHDRLWGVLDIGFSGSLLAVALGDTCIYVRSSPIGGHSITTTVGNTLQLDYGTAETLKRNCATPRQEPEASGCTPTGINQIPETLQHRMAELNSLVQPVLRSRMRALAGDVGRAFSYAMKSYPEATPTELYVCGGSAKLINLPETLQELLGIDVLRLNPCLGITPQRHGLPVQTTHQPSLAACVGLALGDIE
ncbi:MAG: pilus assembly protein PilM [Planctomycetota bacterium]